MEYPAEFITGIMITAAALISMAGIMLAVGSSHTSFGRKPRLWLLFSTVCGLAALFFSMVWFDSPTTIKKLVALIAVAAQLFIIYYPLIRLVKVIDQD